MNTISQRIDNITGIPEKYLDTVIPCPPSVKIELTSRCNFLCSYCAHGNGNVNDSKGKDMDFDLFKRLVSEMRYEGVEELGMFYIGESLLYPQLAEAIKFAKGIGFSYVFLTTNGSLATKERVETLMDAGLDSLKFSLNTADMWQFRQLTGMAPSMFNRVIGNVKEAFEVREKGGYKTKLYASSIRYDGKQGEKMRALIETVKPFVDEHYWLPLLSFGDSAKKIKENGYHTVVGNPGRADMMRAPLPCWAVFKEGHITVEGKLSACCFDASDRWIMGDLTKDAFMEAWNSEEFQKLRAAHLAGDVHGTACAGCIYGEED